MPTYDEVLAAIGRERAWQDQKHGPVDQHPHQIGAWLTILRRELREAEDAWCTQRGDAGALEELLQVASVCVACLTQHSFEYLGGDWTQETPSVVLEVGSFITMLQVALNAAEKECWFGGMSVNQPAVLSLVQEISMILLTVFVHTALSNRRSFEAMSTTSTDEVRYAGADWVRTFCPNISPLGAKAADILGIVFKGIYNAPIKRDQVAWSDPFNIRVVVGHGGFDTYDNDALTRLVLAAHALCVRVEVNPCSPRHLELVFCSRERTGGSWQRHPTIAQAVEQFQTLFGYLEVERESSVELASTPAVDSQS